MRCVRAVPTGPWLGRGALHSKISVSQTANQPSAFVISVSPTIDKPGKVSRTSSDDVACNPSGGGDVSRTLGLFEDPEESSLALASAGRDRSAARSEIVAASLLSSHHSPITHKA